MSSKIDKIPMIKAIGFTALMLAIAFLIVVYGVRMLRENEPEANLKYEDGKLSINSKPQPIPKIKGMIK